MVTMTKLKHAISETTPAATKATAYVIGVKADGVKSALAHSSLDAKFLASINLESLGVSSALGQNHKGFRAKFERRAFDWVRPFEIP
jgi:hypothetical protein